MVIQEGERPRSGVADMPASGPNDAVENAEVERGRGGAQLRRCVGEPSKE